MAIRSPSDFSRFRPGGFHIVLQTRKTQHTQLRVEERRTNKHGLGHLLSICASVSFTSEHSKIPTQQPGMLTHPLALADPASGSTGLNSSLSSRFSLTLALPRLQSTTLGPCPPSSSSNLVEHFARKTFVWVSRQSRNPLTGTHPNPQKRTAPIVPQLCVRAFQPSPTLSDSIHTHILGNEKKTKKEADYIFIHQRCWLSLLSIFKRTESDLNSEFSYSLTGCLKKLNEPSLPF